MATPHAEAVSAPGFCARALTAPGVAAIAVVKLWGPGAARFLAERLRPVNSAARVSAPAGVSGPAGVSAQSLLPAAGRLKRMTWIEGGVATDDVIVVHLPPESGGGFEIQGHGGTAGVVAWQRAVAHSGGVWVDATGAATGTGGHGTSGDSTAALLTADAWALDFARLWPLVQTELQAQVVARSAAAVARCWREQPERRHWPAAWFAELLAGAEARMDLLRPSQILLAGPVNAGKSTLLNALLADRRALTSAEPGTTRDPVRARIGLAGRAVEWIDSAGLRPDGVAATDIEQRSIARTLETQPAVDLTVWLSPVDQPVAPPMHWQRVLAVQSKADLRAGRGGVVADASANADPNVLAFSATTGAGLNELCAAVAARLWGADADGRSLSAGVCTGAQKVVLEQWLREAAQRKP